MSIPAPQSLDHGIHLIPVPLPYKSPPWVNVYAVESNGGLLLIDCGTDWEPGREAIRQGFADLGLEESAVHTLVVSHLHPDHVGMSARLVSDWGCRFVMHERAAKLVDQYNDSPGYMSRLVRIGSAHGIPDSATNAATQVERPDYMPLLEPPDFLVRDGETIDLGDGRSLHVVHTPGHEPAHICLRDSRTGILFSGDCILAAGTTAVRPDEGGDMAAFVASLQKLAALDLKLILSFHGAPVTDPKSRIDELLRHRAERDAQIMAALRDGVSQVDAIRDRLYADASLPESRWQMAREQVVAHLRKLEAEGRIQAVEPDLRYRLP